MQCSRRPKSSNPEGKEGRGGTQGAKERRGGSLGWGEEMGGSGRHEEEKQREKRRRGREGDGIAVYLQFFDGGLPAYPPVPQGGVHQRHGNEPEEMQGKGANMDQLELCLLLLLPLPVLLLLLRLLSSCCWRLREYRRSMPATLASARTGIMKNKGRSHGKSSREEGKDGGGRDEVGGGRNPRRP
eukprot:766761-Hanusia_phi.AAC.5